MADFIDLCLCGKLNEANKLYLSEEINIHARNEHVFRYSCQMGLIKIAKWLYNLGKTTNNKINIHAENEYAFKHSCGAGHIEIAKWLYELGMLENKNIDIHAENEAAFRWSCSNGFVEVAKWLYKMSKSENNNIINIFAENEYAFRWSCEGGEIKVAEWLCTLCEDYKIEITDEGIKYIIANPLDELIESKEHDKIIKKIDFIKKTNENEECMICLEIKDDIMIKINKEQVFCVRCVHKWDVSDKPVFCVDCICEWKLSGNHNGCIYCK